MTKKILTGTAIDQFGEERQFGHDAELVSETQGSGLLGSWVRREYRLLEDAPMYGHKKGDLVAEMDWV